MIGAAYNVGAAASSGGVSTSAASLGASMTDVAVVAVVAVVAAVAAVVVAVVAAVAAVVSALGQPREVAGVAAAGRFKFHASSRLLGSDGTRVGQNRQCDPVLPCDGPLFLRGAGAM